MKITRFDRESIVDLFELKVRIYGLEGFQFLINEIFEIGSMRGITDCRNLYYRVERYFYQMIKLISIIRKICLNKILLENNFCFFFN